MVQASSTDATRWQVKCPGHVLPGVDPRLHVLAHLETPDELKKVGGERELWTSLLLIFKNLICKSEALIIHLQ